MCINTRLLTSVSTEIDRQSNYILEACTYTAMKKIFLLQETTASLQYATFRTRLTFELLFLQEVELVVSTAHKNPSNAWALLAGEALALHPDRIRLVCRVCRIALDHGMAQQVRQEYDRNTCACDTACFVVTRQTLHASCWPTI